MKYGELNLGQIEAIVNKLGGMDGVQHFLAGHTEVKLIENLINLDADPFIPEGLTVEKHQKGGIFKWNPKEVELFLFNQQKKGTIEGNKLRKELKGKSVFNANLLDYLLEHPHLIPEGWKQDEHMFWGTIYRGSSGNLCVRGLYWFGGRWDWRFIWLGLGWSVRSPAALRAS